MDFTRQRNIFDPEKDNTRIIIIGAGSTGSFTAFTLAKMGIKDIEVIDYDTIEEANIPNQYYRIADIGKLKTEALKEIIKDFSGVEIRENRVKIDQNFIFDLNMETIIINCVDNIETRKIVIDILAGIPTMLIDTRFGGEGYSIHCLVTSEEEEVKHYKESLEGEIKETVCGEKGIIYTINSLASEVCSIIKKIADKKETPKMLRRELKTYRFIEKRGEKKQ